MMDLIDYVGLLLVLSPVGNYDSHSLKTCFMSNTVKYSFAVFSLYQIFSLQGFGTEKF